MYLPHVSCTLVQTYALVWPHISTNCLRIQLWAILSDVAAADAGCVWCCAQEQLLLAAAHPG